MKLNVLKLALFFMVMIGAESASAALDVANQVDFNGAETIIDFNNILDTESINEQFTDSGVTFGGSLVGLTNNEDILAFNGSTIASNWDYNGTGNTGPSWTSTFSSTQKIVGFFARSNTEDDVTIEAFLGGSSIGSVNFLNQNGIIPDFLAVQSSLGFDKIIVTTAVNKNGFFAMDDFKFHNSAVVPIPGAIWLFGAALVGMIRIGKIKRQSEAA